MQPDCSHDRLLRALAQNRANVLWHLGFGLELALFFVGHMVMVATTGLRNTLNAIVTGWHYPPAAPVERHYVDDIAA